MLCKLVFRHRRFLVILLLVAISAVEGWFLVRGPAGPAAIVAVDKALDAGVQPEWEDLADMGLHYAGWINLILALLLAATHRWWMRTASSVEISPAAEPGRPSWWRWRWWTALLMIGGFALYYGNASFAQKGLWWDEIWALKHASHGQWKADKKNEGELSFKPTTWKRCAFYYPKPTNHAPMSLLQKTSLNLWRKITGAAEHEFSEIIVRLPSLIASGIAVLLILRLVGVMGGVFAMGLLLALHPWHLRYGVDARAYPLIVPLVLSSILAAQRVITTRARNVPTLIWFALSQGLWAYTFMPAWASIGLMFLVVAFALWRGEDNLQDRLTVLTRLCVAQTAAVMIWVQVFLPNFVQIKHWYEPGDTPYLINSSVLASTKSHMLFGMEWTRPETGTVEASSLTSLEQVVGSGPGAAALMIVSALLTLLGLFMAFRKAPAIASLMAAVVLGVWTYMAVTRLAGTNFYPRFAMPLLPVTVLCWSMIPLVLKSLLWQRAFGAGLVAAFALITSGQREVLRTVPYKPLKEVAAYLKERVKEAPKGEHPQVLCFGLGREALSAYYPDMTSTSDVEVLRQAIEKARATEQDLLVVKGYAFFNKAIVTEGHDLITDPQEFDELEGWPGLESNFYFRVYRLRGNEKWVEPTASMNPRLVSGPIEPRRGMSEY